MKNFFKLTKGKIVLALGILAFHFIEIILYSRNLACSFISTGEKGEINIVLKIIHYVFQIIFIPYNLVNDIFIKFGKCFFSNDIDFINYSSVATIILVPLFIFYCYFLGCLAYFLIKKKRK